MSDYYDIYGKPIGMDQWVALWGDMGYRRIGWTQIDEFTNVSTIWLGLDHSFAWVPNPPIIFETMVFGEHDTLDQDVQLRYSTLQDAQQGHNDVVSMMRALRTVEDPRTDVHAPQGPLPVYLGKPWVKAP